jgi:putative ABC transport system permease protein
MKNKLFKSLSSKLYLNRPLAWSQLAHQKTRLAVAMGGIAFANVLIFMQLGFQSLFSEGATVLPEKLAGDLFVINPDTEYIGSSSFDRLRLYQAASVKGVADSTALYINIGTWAYSSANKSYQARIFAYNPNKTIWKIAELNQQGNKLNLTNNVLFDRRAKSTFGPIAKLVTEKGEAKAILNNNRVFAVGLFSLGNSFFLGEGNIVTSEVTFAKIFGDNTLNSVNLGIITLESGANPEAVKAGIKANVTGIAILTHEELLAKELKFQETTATAPIFGFGTVMGFIVGIVIVYQVLYADVTDHISEYATLKAMGYSNTKLLVVIFQEALILGVLGFVPGFGVSFFMYGFLGGLTRLELVMRLDVAITVFVLTIVMCMMSAAIASNKLRSADPAEIF